MWINLHFVFCVPVDDERQKEIIKHWAPTVREKLNMVLI